MAVREKIVRLCQKISGMDKPYTMEDPEYYCLECVVSDEQAEVALHMERRIPITPEKLAKPR